MPTHRVYILRMSTMLRHDQLEDGLVLGRIIGFAEDANNVVTASSCQKT